MRACARGIAEAVRSTAAQVPRLWQDGTEEAAFAAGIPPEGFRVVRDRLQVGQGGQAQPCRCTGEGTQGGGKEGREEERGSENRRQERNEAGDGRGARRQC